MEKDRARAVTLARVTSAVRAARLASKLTRTDLSERAGVPLPTLSRLESGDRVPDYATIEAIADLLQVPVNVLAGNPSAATIRVGKTDCIVRRVGALSAGAGPIDSSVLLAIESELYNMRTVQEELDGTLFIEPTRTRRSNVSWKKRIGLAIWTARDERRVSRETLRDLVGMSMSSLAHLESGSTIPDIITWANIAHALQMPIDEITGRAWAVGSMRFDVRVKGVVYRLFFRRHYAKTEIREDINYEVASEPVAPPEPNEPAALSQEQSDIAIPIQDQYEIALRAVIRFLLTANDDAFFDSLTADEMPIIRSLMGSPEAALVASKSRHDSRSQETLENNSFPSLATLRDMKLTPSPPPPQKEKWQRRSFS